MFLKTQNDFKLINGDAASVLKALNNGVYKIEKRKEGFSYAIYLTPATERREDTMLTSGVFGEINANLNAFFEPSMIKARKAVGCLNKFACLIYGEQGSGKTHHALLWAQKIAREKNAISIIINDIGNFKLSPLVDAIRDNDPDRFIVLVFEEFEKSSINLRNSDFLSFLDGADSKDNLIILATCNDVSRMPDILLDRPGRFEKKFKLTSGNRDVMRSMLKSIMPKEYVGRINTEHILDVLEAKGKWTVDYIRLLLRNSIAELLFEEEHDFQRQFPELFDDETDKLLEVRAANITEPLDEDNDCDIKYGDRDEDDDFDDSISILTDEI